MFYTNKNIEILKKAFPHLDNQRQRSINIILKMAELNESIHELSNVSSMVSCDNEHKQTNVEELLRSIKPVCPKKDQEIIDFALNFNKTKDIYNTYKAFNTSSGINNKLDFFKDKFSREQLDTINQLNALINND